MPDATYPTNKSTYNMTPIKNIITAVFACVTCISVTAHAETAAFYAGKIVQNCDYDASLSTALSKSFSAQDLRTLRIAISIDDVVCKQTFDFLASPKVTRKTSHQFVQRVYKNHQAAFGEAEASN